jgi:ADP-ribosylglycohydrolase
VKEAAVADSEREMREAVRRSALWAAYGDALGFITEFADSSAVQRRAGSREVHSTVPWTRRVGGQFGVQAALPAGAISDDTQLRLATCRTMLPDGSFDVEAFSKVELTVWPAYALGAGRGSRAAAAHLTRRDTTWASNFFSQRGTDYLAAGGNGAAMRIQPHIWAAGARPAEAVLHDVLANAISTHGHPRGFMGAFFHAGCLQIVLSEGRPSEPRDWRSIVDRFEWAVALLREDPTVRDLWLGPWERRSERSLPRAIAEVAEEMRADIDRLERVRPSQGVGGLRTAVEELGAYAAEQRGSGTKTSLLAAAAAWIFGSDARSGVLACANALGTDTDTVATIAGALMGPLTRDEPDGELQDADYIAREAERMWAIGAGRRVPPFPFVDVLNWVPPRSQSDVVGSIEDGLSLAGLGPARVLGPSWEAPGRDSVAFEWVRLWFGQTVLVKRRAEVGALPATSVVRPSSDYVEAPLAEALPRATGAAVAGLRRSGGHRTPVREPRTRRETSRGLAGETLDGAVRDLLVAVDRSRSMHALTDIVIKSGFLPEVVGAGLLKAIDGDGSDQGIERGTSYAAIIAKARQARRGS